MPRRDSSFVIGAWGLRGDLGGIFVKIPPKTSKNALLRNAGFIVEGRAVVLG